MRRAALLAVLLLALVAPPAVARGQNRGELVSSMNHQGVRSDLYLRGDTYTLFLNGEPAATASR